jgi:predicted Zn finger-like uncharacterized protein
MPERRKAENETCPNCKAQYEVTKVNLPVKDRDFFTCECGQQVKAWKGTASYEYKRISE